MDNNYNWNTAPQSGSQSWYRSNPYGYTNNVNNGINTNVYKVTSLEEAIMRSNAFPSENVYFNQSKNEFYNIRVDVNGNKTWQTFVYNVAGSDDTAPVTRAEFDALAAKVAALEPVKEPSKEGDVNA